MDIERYLLGREILWLLVIILIVMLFLPGCAAVPECPAAGAMVLEVNDGRILYAFDHDGLTAWYDAIKAEAHGECRWPAKGDRL